MQFQFNQTSTYTGPAYNPIHLARPSFRTCMQAIIAAAAVRSRVGEKFHRRRGGDRDRGSGGERSEEGGQAEQGIIAGSHN